MIYLKRASNPEGGGDGVALPFWGGDRVGSLQFATLLKPTCGRFKFVGLASWYGLPHRARGMLDSAYMTVWHSFPPHRTSDAATTELAPSFSSDHHLLHW
ncbi:hypothetical protein C2S52_011110 [Perilla frutescens var. hirtella]|nr:hypothetical protein C2S52_011110 [Perilla frutescens var. hirtella]